MGRGSTTRQNSPRIAGRVGDPFKVDRSLFSKYDKSEYKKSSPTQKVVTPISLQDPKQFQEALGLINRDVLPGQPICTDAMLAQAIEGRSPIDNKYWEDLKALEHIGVIENNELLGVAAFGIRKNGTGALLWMHANENIQVIEALLNYLEQKLASCSKIEAFEHATALNVGIESLPHRRQATHTALLNRGYQGKDSWLYMMNSIKVKGTVSAQVKKIEEDEPGQTFQLTLSSKDKEVASAMVGITGEGVGVVWWLETEPEHREQGLGRKMLLQAETVLAEQGITEAILLVDHDAPDGKRIPAIKLYQSEGWQIVDHLWSYTKKGEKDV